MNRAPDGMNNILQPVLVVAPHMVLPVRNGSDISLERVARYLSRFAPHVDLIGSETIRRYRLAELESERHFGGGLRPKSGAALRTLLLRSHYYKERFNTPAIQQSVREHMAGGGYSTVLASYLTTLTVLPPARTGELRLAWTHNDEFKWYEDIVRTARNPLTRMVARQSLKWLSGEVPQLAAQAVFLHVSKADAGGFERVVPKHRHLVVSVGTDIDPVSQWPDFQADGPVILSFMATLGVKMAMDALDHFRTRFEPTLRAAFGSKLEIRIIGSQPAPAVVELCRTAGWKLFPDVPEDDFTRLLNESTFTLLPFAYATGIKLKLIRSLGGGVPFLSTTASQPSGFPVLPGCCFSDAPSDWCAAIKAWQNNPDRFGARQQMLVHARSYSWPAVVAELAAQLQKLKSSSASVRTG